MAQEQRTEQATPRKLQKARERGDFPAARVLLSAVQLMLFVWLLESYGPAALAAFGRYIQWLFSFGLSGRIGEPTLLTLFAGGLTQLLWPGVVLAFASIAAMAAVQMTISRFGIATQKLVPEISRLSPAAKLRNLPSQNLSSFAQAVILVPVFTWVIFVIFRDNGVSFLTLPLMSVASGITTVTESLMTLLWRGSWLFLLFGVADAFRQNSQYKKQLRMTKQEVREEAKDISGNPIVKQRIRRILREMARQRMMTAVPKATAVIVNPTHYAVAIQYEGKGNAAPKVVAKGRNVLAARIRILAQQHEVPIIENPPLAQAIYRTVKVDQEIPVELYRAVAEVLAYVFRTAQRFGVGTARGRSGTE